MKKLFALILTLAMLCSLAVPAFATEPTEEAADAELILEAEETPEEIVQSKGGVAGQVNVLWDGECMKFPIAAPEIKNDRTMVPVRAVLEGMNATVDYNDADKSVSISMGDKNAVVTFVIGSQTATVSEGGVDTEIQMDCASYLKNDSTMVPLRFLSEACGYTVLWDQDCKTAVVINRDAWAKDADALLGKLNELYVAAINAEEPVSSQTTSAFSTQLKLNNATENQSMDIAFSGQETITIDGTQAYIEGTLDLSSLYDMAKEMSDGMDLSKFLAVLKNNPSATPYTILADAKGDAYINIPLLNVLCFDVEENAWIHLGNSADYGVSVSEPPATIGCLLADVVIANAENSPIEAYDTFALSMLGIAAIFGDDTAEDAGNGGYTWSLDKSDLAKAMGEEFSKDISFSTTLFPDNTGKVDAEVNLGELLNASFSCAEEKDKGNLKLDVALKLGEMDLSFNLTADSTMKTDGYTAPSFTLPAGAKTVEWDQIEAQLEAVKTQMETAIQ